MIDLANINTDVVMYGVLAIVVGLYGPRLHPVLPDNIRNIFECKLIRFSIIAIIIYLSNKNLQLALILSIGFMIGMSISGSQSHIEQFKNKCAESFSDFKDIAEFYEESFEGGADGPAPEAVSENMDEIHTESSLENFYSEPRSDLKSNNTGFWNNIERFELQVDEDYNDGGGVDDIDAVGESFTTENIPTNNLSDYQSQLQQTVDNYTF